MKLQFRVLLLSYGKVVHIRKYSFDDYSLCGQWVKKPFSRPAKKSKEQTSFLVELEKQELGERLTIWELPLCKKCERSAKTRWGSKVTGFEYYNKRENK